MRSPSIPNNSAAGWTILKVLQWTTAYFRRQGIESARLDAEVLLAYALGYKRIDLYLSYDQPLKKDELALFRQLIKRRADREPVAYILGRKEFWSLNFSVSKDVLIPRPETECLVETALKIAKQAEASKGLSVLELGTGSGAIIIALASEMPTCSFTAVDISLQALKIAKQNAQKLLEKNSINWLAADWLTALKEDHARFDLILSNPPYIRKNLIKELDPEVSRFEPVTALDGGLEGLDSYQQIIPAALEKLHPGGSLLLEIGFDQKRSVQKLAEQCSGVELVDFKKDYSGHFRIAIIKKF